MSLPIKKFLFAVAMTLAISAQAQWLKPSANTPLYFEDQGAEAASHFLARGQNYQFLISPSETRLILQKAIPATPLPFARTGFAAPGKISTRAVGMQFVGANPQAQIFGEEELPGKINYLIGNDSSQWRQNVSIFAKARITELYPGIDLTYYGNQQRLEYDFTIAPKSDPKKIVIHFDGADEISIDAKGALILKLGNDEICQPAPQIYQTIAGARKEISGGYTLLNAQTVGFAIGKYNHNVPLVIDPLLSYSTYFGGNGNDTAWKTALDTNGFIYVTGQTLSAQFFPTPGAYQTNFAGGSDSGDAFVAKLSNAGSQLVYLTYLGGSGDDLASSMAVDDAGDVYLTGVTGSTNFPTVSALYTNLGGATTPAGFYGDAFVSELNTNGSALIYSTYLGGSNLDEGTGIAVDAAGNAYVTGFTASTNFPVLNPLAFTLPGATNASLNQLAGNYDAFLTKIGAGGSPLKYSTYFGGTNFDVGEGVAVDSAGFVYVAGFTDSADFPTTNALQTLLGNTTNLVSTYDAFVARFAPSDTNLTLVYSTYLGGTNDDLGYGLAVDAVGNAYIAGQTASPDFPETATNVAGLHQFVTNNLSGILVTTNAFLAKINSSGTNVVYSAVFGGFVADAAYDVALDPAGDAFVIGATSSTNFPTTNTTGFLSPTNSGGNDAFVTAFNADGSALLYSACLGGSGDDFGYGIAVDPMGNAYIAGQTASANFPVLNAGQNSINGVSDAFLAKILLGEPTLGVSRNNGSITLAWPAFQSEYALESNTNLTSSNAWTAVSAPRVLTNGLETATVPATNDNLFFRLHKF